MDMLRLVVQLRQRYGHFRHADTEEAIVWPYSVCRYSTTML
jgi:hypothetical protein